MKLRDIPTIVLSDSPTPLSAREIWNEAVRRGLDKAVESNGKTPDATIGAYLYTNAKGDHSLFVAVGAKPTRFRLAEMQSNQPMLPFPSDVASPSSKSIASSWTSQTKSQFLAPCIEALKKNAPAALGVGEIIKAVMAAHPDLRWARSNGAIRAALLRAAKMGSNVRTVPESRPPKFFFVPVAEDAPSSILPPEPPIPPKTSPKKASPHYEQVGWVYILTNPSFREDWVKIGKSSRPVDVRSKELDNTAVPLPFEIFATLKTAKYEIVEKQMHKAIDRLTHLRIRKNREFFNIDPQKAYEQLSDLAESLDDAELLRYENNKPISKKPQQPNCSRRVSPSRSAPGCSRAEPIPHKNHHPPLGAWPTYTALAKAIADKNGKSGTAGGIQQKLTNFWVPSRRRYAKANAATRQMLSSYKVDFDDDGFVKSCANVPYPLP